MFCLGLNAHGPLKYCSEGHFWPASYFQMRRPDDMTSELRIEGYVKNSFIILLRDLYGHQEFFIILAWRRVQWLG